MMRQMTNRTDAVRLTLSPRGDVVTAYDPGWQAAPAIWLCHHEVLFRTLYMFFSGIIIIML